MRRLHRDASPSMVVGPFDWPLVVHSRCQPFRSAIFVSIELGSFAGNFVHLHFADNLVAPDSTRAADFGTNAHRLAHSRLTVADIAAAVEVVAAVGLAPVVFVRETVASGKSAAMAPHCERDAYKSVYFADGLVPMTLAAPQMVVSVMC